MKFAPWVAGCALGIIVLTLSTAKAITPPRVVTALDTVGIDTLEVRSNHNVDITISSSEPAFATFDNSTAARFSAHREGSRLVLDAHMEGYENLKLLVPASIHRYLLQDGALHTKERLPSVELLATGDVSWDGDARQLVMRDVNGSKRPSKCDQCGTATDFSVGGGDIGEALFYSPEGRLKLQDPDAIDSVYAWLGPDGGITLDGARRFDHIHLVPSEAQMPAAR